MTPPNLIRSSTLVQGRFGPYGGQYVPETIMPALLELEADVMAVDKPLLLSSVVEDEFLLAMPMVPLHDLSKCPGKVYVAGAASPAKESVKTGKVKKNPFSVLNELKRTK